MMDNQQEYMWMPMGDAVTFTPLNDYGRTMVMNQGHSAALINSPILKNE